MINNSIKILIAVIVFTTSLIANGNTKVSSFSKAKKILKNKIYTTDELKVGIYSKCSYESKRIKSKNGKNKYKLVVNKDSCNYKPRTKSKRANYLSINLAKR